MRVSPQPTHAMSTSVLINEQYLSQMREDLLDSLDEEFELELEDGLTDPRPRSETHASDRMQYFLSLIHI